MEDKVRELIEKSIIELGYILDDVKYVKENNVNFLRIIIDKEGYITINDCVKVNEVIDPILDNMNFIDDSYIIDVCSKEKGRD